MPNVIFFPSSDLLKPSDRLDGKKTESLARRRFSVGGKRFHLKVDPQFVSMIRLTGGWLAANLGSALRGRSDSLTIAYGLQAREREISFAVDGSLTGPIALDVDELRIKVHPAFAEIEHRGVASALICAGTAVLLGEVFGNPAVVSRTTREEATRLFLLLLAENLAIAGEVTPSDVVQGLGCVLPQSDSLAVMIRNKFHEFTESVAWQRHAAASERTRVFLFPAAFGRLERSEKRRAIVGGILAWYDFLMLGLLRFVPFIRSHPYFIPARMVLRGWLGERELFAGGAARRLKRALGKGRIVTASEAFWAGWSPRLTAIILKPVYRFLGGNRRPFLATLGTFSLTAIIVHPLWITLGLTGVAALLYLPYPAEIAATRILHPINFILHGIVIGLWVGWGFVIGLLKWKRFRVERQASGVESLGS
ncbi:MAG: hypothetical protein E3J72_21590 [Planctomycetota bacterium]|nr:MAG: hypothetical protein E3J72_21590 [Planctomycetota bacterium]